jgi:hypothetical protein
VSSGPENAEDGVAFENVPSALIVVRVADSVDAKARAKINAIESRIP